MRNSFVEELEWRGMLHDIMPETEHHLNQGPPVILVLTLLPIRSTLEVWCKFCPYAFSAGHQPIALVGGATGMIGDPSGKSMKEIY